jgi:PAS domain S-box-containing protein
VNGSADVVRVILDDGGFAAFDENSFRFRGKPASLALAFVSPFLDFEATVRRLTALAGDTPLVATSTAGELCALSPADPLYRPLDEARPNLTVQVFAADLLSAAVRSVGLHAGGQRAEAIAADLARIELPFAINAADTLALAFCDGLTGGEDHLMEAVYRDGRFPCLFVGGSAGGRLDFSGTWLFDGNKVLTDHATIVFLKLAPGKRYGVLKSQNFRKTGKSFVVVDADPATRTVSALLDPADDTPRPAIDFLAESLSTDAAHLADALTGFTFGIEIDDEIFVRSVSRIDHEKGCLHFFCDVNQGDELLLLEATDFATQTRADVAAFLADKPPPLAVVLNDCILRRLNNGGELDLLRGLWPCPAAGFSTFGELLGININQTLTAVAFFDAADGPVADDFVDRFAVHYARFHTYFTRRRLHRLEIVNRLRAEITRRLTQHLGASPELAGEIEGVLTHVSDVRASLDNLRATISREVEAERRARKAEQQLTDAIETISEGFALYDAEDRLVLANSQLRAMFPGVHDAFVIGRPFAEIMHHAALCGLYGYQGAELERFLAQRLKAHRAADGRPTLQHMADGSWLINRENRTRDGGIVGVRTDVTELKAREAELEHLKSRYELILSAAGDGIVGIDVEGRVSFANPAAARMLDVSPTEMGGLPFGRALKSPDIPGFPLCCSQAEVDECLCHRADGSPFTAEYILTPICEDKHFAGAVLVFRDVSLRKRYQESLADHQKELERQVAERTRELSAEIAERIKIDRALQESRRRLLGITSSLFEGVLLVDAFGVVGFANPSAHRWLGATTLTERLLDEVLTLEEGDRRVGFAEGPFRRVIDRGETVTDDDAVFVIDDDRRLPVAFAAAPLEEGGRIRIAVISFRGIEALKEAQREALQSSRLASVGQLAAGIAHEINTPIQYIGDNLHYIEDTFPDVVATLAEMKAALPPETGEALMRRHGIDELLDDYPDAIGQALQGVGHVTQIVRSMKDFSHPGGGAKVGTDVNAAIASTATVCRNEWKHVASLVTDLAPDLPKIMCFPSDINQVFLNLIVNAAQAIAEQGPRPPGTIRIATRLDGDWLEIRISDDGPGVPKALRSRIFDPFFTTKAVGKGTGQGLSICQDIVVKKHHGQIFLDETVPSGATFVVRLPVVDEDRP